MVVLEHIWSIWQYCVRVEGSCEKLNGLYFGDVHVLFNTSGTLMSILKYRFNLQMVSVYYFLIHKHLFNHLWRPGYLPILDINWHKLLYFCYIIIKHVVIYSVLGYEEGNKYTMNINTCCQESWSCWTKSGFRWWPSVQNK